jgi:hypothetical protein
MTWLHAIDTAALEANVTVQLCMMCEPDVSILEPLVHID